MYVWNTTRNQSSFDTFHATSVSFYTTSSAGDSASLTEGGTISLMTDVEGGSSTYITSASITQAARGSSAGSFSAVQLTNSTVISAFSALTTAEDGYQSVSNADAGGHVTTSETSFATSDTFSGSYPLAYTVTFQDTYTGSYITASAVDTTTVAYYFPSGGGYATSGATTTAFSNVSSYSSGDGSGASTYQNFCYTSGTFTSVGFSGVVTGATTYIEIGTIVSGGPDWVWSLTGTLTGDFQWNSNINFLSGLATTFDVATFWPVVSSYEVTFATYLGSQTGQLYSGTNTTGSFGYQITTTQGSGTFEQTVGNTFSHDTSSGIGFLSTVTGATISSGTPIPSLFVYDSSDVAGMTTVSPTFRRATVVATIPENISDQSTITLNGIETYYSTYTSASLLPLYMASDSSSSSSTDGDSFGTTYSMTATQSSSATMLLNFQYVSYNDTATIIGPTMPVGAFASSLGDNSPFFDLGIDGGTIYYPFTSSFLNNFAFIVPSNTSAWDAIEDVTWKYFWSDDTLLYTTLSTYTDLVSGNTITEVDSTASSGVFAGITPLDSYFSTEGTILGGYCDVSESAESAYIPRNAGYYTTISTNGDSTTSNVIFNSSTSSTAQGEMIISQSAFAIITFNTTADGGMGIPVFAFERNQE